MEQSKIIDTLEMYHAVGIAVIIVILSLAGGSGVAVARAFRSALQASTRSPEELHDKRVGSYKPKVKEVPLP